MLRRADVVALAVSLIGCAAIGAVAVTVVSGSDRIEVDTATLKEVHGVVSYQGGGEDNWTDTLSYTGVAVSDLLAAVGGVSEEDTVSFVSSDGFFRTVPATAIGERFEGAAILALSAEGTDETWDEAPLLVFLPSDETFGTQDMIALVGPTFSDGLRSAKSLMVRNVAYVVVNYEGQDLSADVDTPTVLSVVVGEEATDYTLESLERVGLVTAQALGADEAPFYSGVSLRDLIGEIEADAVIRFVYGNGRTDVVTAERIRANDPSILVALLEDGSYLDVEQGLVLVDTGTSGSEAELPLEPIVVIDVPETYEPSSLELAGTTQYSLSREVLESSVHWSGAPATASVSRSGSETSYVGLPLWRAIAYIDDETAPVGDGLVFDDGAFGSDTEGVTVTVIAADGFSQSFPLDLVAGDDRFVLATLKSGLFLDVEESGTVIFAFDDSVELPEGMKLWTVKFVVRIELSSSEAP